MTTWVALFILALGGMMLVGSESGMIAGLDATTFGYGAFLLALLVYLEAVWSPGTAAAREPWSAMR